MTAREYLPICPEKALYTGRVMKRNTLHSNIFGRSVTVGLVVGSPIKAADLADSSRPGAHLAQPLVRKIGVGCA